MAYIIKNVLKELDDQLIRQSYVIDDEQIVYANGQLNAIAYPHLHVSDFRIAPGRVMCGEQLAKAEDPADFKNRMGRLLEKGCTTVIYYAKADYERSLPFEIKRAFHQMNNSFLDYVIGLAIPLILLRPSVLRLCKSKKIPLIRFQVSCLDELLLVPWSRLKEPLFHYPVVFQPDFRLLSTKEQKQAMKIWERIATNIKLPTCVESLEDNESWSKSSTQKMGIYPRKGELRVGGDADYLLYYQPHSSASVAESNELDYDKDKPNVVVLRGRVLKANQFVKIRPGSGKAIPVLRPGQFLQIADATV
ncbi:hypothetical protein [Halalkalibacterium ligniniphilum]|uniref:hypothetical protein n=1 Tax=Halalkalibacterium ligniniphilum TaxID=1134413 RepID=UPI000360C29D|nr:hypothetical protein [Halalkalibacterium ligniniphilum]